MIKIRVLKLGLGTQFKVDNEYRAEIEEKIVRIFDDNEKDYIYNIEILNNDLIKMIEIVE